MKRVQLIEWGIITIGLIFGYKFMEGMISVVIQFISAMVLDSLDIMVMVPSLIITIIYLAILIGAIRYSRNIAAYINGAENAEDTINLKIGKRSLIHIILITLCAFTILNNIANVLYNLYATFKSEVNSRGIDNDLFMQKSNPAVSLIIPCIQIVAAIIVIAYSKKIADLVLPKSELDELVLDSKPEN